MGQKTENDQVTRLRRMAQLYVDGRHDLVKQGALIALILAGAQGEYAALEEVLKDNQDLEPLYAGVLLYQGKEVRVPDMIREVAEDVADLMRHHARRIAQA